MFTVNRFYLRYLLQQLGKSKGKALERMAHYLIEAMPGCRALIRKRSRSTDYDVVGIVEGEFTDFRSEIGRYFLCECKDWKKPADFTAFAKFCRVLDSTKTRFGILFSSQGISGKKRTTDAERELLKVFQDRGVVIIVIEKSDLQAIVRGTSFVTLLRQKYEQVRFDLSDSAFRNGSVDP